MSTVEGKKQEKRRALLDAAYELFLERGTAKTSVEDITSRAKVGKGTFYLYFQDKGAVMQALLGRVSYQLLSDACEAVEKQTELENFPDKMVAVIDQSWLPSGSAMSWRTCQVRPASSMISIAGPRASASVMISSCSS